MNTSIVIIAVRLKGKRFLVLSCVWASNNLSASLFFNEFGFVGSISTILLCYIIIFF